MPVYFTKRAFLPDGWAADVQIAVDELGGYTAYQHWQ